MSNFLASCLYTPGKNEHSKDASRSPQVLQDFLKPIPKREYLRSCITEEENLSSTKSKMSEAPKASNKVPKKQETKNPSSKKQNRKSENLVPSDGECLNSWICKNSACRAIVSKHDSFCKRCSCFLCHLFDDNKDPSLWLVCTSEESGERDYCGSSCHIECALQKGKAGVVDRGQLVPLDGSYCCPSCGKVSGILGCWKKQLIIARDARRLDVLCYRIYLSYRLLVGTSQFKELHELVKHAKTKLETDVGPVDGTSSKMARGLVSRLSIASDVQKLCSHAIEKADEWLANTSHKNGGCRDSLPSACKFQFEEVTPSTVVLRLIEQSSATSDEIKGYKLWYHMTTEETPTKEPVCVFPRNQRRILISNLQPCTEYTFRIISFMEAGDLGHSEVRCFTKSIEIMQLNHNSADTRKENNNPMENHSPSAEKEEKGISSGFKVRELAKFLHLAWAQKQGSLEGFCSVGNEECCGAGQFPSGSRGFDLNVVSMPDLNEEFTPPADSSKDENNDCVLEQAVEVDDEDNDLMRSNGSGDSRGTAEDAAATDFLGGSGRKRKANLNEEPHECDSALVNGSPTDSSGFDENFEYCVKMIRWLECEGHIDQEFRLKFLTWLSLRSTDQERRVVNTFVLTLIDDPSSLAGQLVDTFSDIISSKKARNEFFCSNLWH